jgi:ankyrin repeat protein
LLNRILIVSNTGSDAQGFTPLHYAAIYNEKETMELLIKHGADTNAVSYTLKLTRELSSDAV